MDFGIVTGSAAMLEKTHLHDLVTGVGALVVMVFALEPGKTPRCKRKSVDKIPKTKNTITYLIPVAIKNINYW